MMMTMIMIIVILIVTTATTTATATATNNNNNKTAVKGKETRKRACKGVLQGRFPRRHVHNVPQPEASQQTSRNEVERSMI
jgi:hypothetical protein